MGNTRLLRENARNQCKFPTINDEFVDSLIKEEHFWIVPGTTTTICAIVLKNGFVVLGESACVDERNFKREMGEKLAFSKARDKIFSLAAYAYCSEKKE